GDDTFEPGGGNDTIDGGSGSDAAYYNNPRSAYTITRNGNGSVTVAGFGQSDTMTRVEKLGFSDQLVSIGTAAPAEFNGEGNSDLLWQNANGQVAMWLMNGAATLSQAIIDNPGPAWHVVGTGDSFNFTGRAGIYWQNSSGQLAVWQMDGTAVKFGTVVGDNP